MKIFIGYASERLPDGRMVYEKLCAPGRDVWFDRENLVGGDDWDAERKAAQKSADLIVHLLSEEILLRAGVVNREIRDTLDMAKDQPFGTTFVVFLRLEDIRLPPEFTRFQYIDMFRSDWPERLAAAVAKRERQLVQIQSRNDRPQKASPVSSVSESTILRVSAIDGPKRIEFENKGERIEAFGSYLEYPGDGLYWKLVNSALCAASLDDYLVGLADITEISKDSADWLAQRGQSLSVSTSMEEFFRKGNLVSTRSYYFVDFGGAHPNHHVSSRNFIGPELGSCSIERMLSNEVARGKKVLNYCKAVLSAQLDGALEDNTFFDTESPTAIWQLLSQYNIDQKGLTINFSPYDILPYAFGVHEVLIPWSFLHGCINSSVWPLLNDLLFEGEPVIWGEP